MEYLYKGVWQMKRYIILIIDFIVLAIPAGASKDFFQTDEYVPIVILVAALLNFYILPLFFNKTIGAAITGAYCGSINKSTGELYFSHVRAILKVVCIPIIIFVGIFATALRFNTKEDFVSLKKDIKHNKAKMKEMEDKGYVSGYAMLYDRILGIYYFQIIK